MEGFAAVVAFKEDRESCRSCRPIGVGIGRVEFPALVEARERLAPHERQRIKTVVSLVVIESGWQSIEAIESQCGRDGDDAHQGQGGPQAAAGNHRCELCQHDSNEQPVRPAGHTTYVILQGVSIVVRIKG